MRIQEGRGVDLHLRVSHSKRTMAETDQMAKTRHLINNLQEKTCLCKKMGLKSLQK